MVQEQDWTDAYKEFCIILETQVPEVKHIDLWYEQTNYLEQEYPFPEQCVFIDIDAEDIETAGNNVQNMNCIVTFYHVYKTLSDTFNQSNNQSTALAFMPVSKKIHKAFQNVSGVNFSPLDRKTNKRVPHPEGYLYIRAQSYQCIITDYSAMKEYTQTTVNSIGIDRSQEPIQPLDGLYEINL